MGRASNSPRYNILAWSCVVLIGGMAILYLGMLLLGPLIGIAVT
jgi:hypothetical protein